MELAVWANIIVQSDILGELCSQLLISLQLMDTILFKQKRLEVAIHVISWLLIFAFPILITEWGHAINWAQCLRRSIIPLYCCGVFYINYLWLIPKYLFDGHGRIFLLINMVLIIGSTLELHFIHTAIAVPPHPGHSLQAMPAPPPPRQLMFLSRDLIMLVFVVGLSVAIRMSGRWIYTEERLAQAEKEKSEAELKNLKNQLNPHFLLNTLNNIYALIAIDRDKAQETVQELGKMLRYILYDNQSSKVSLEKELEFIDNYISLMRIRLPKSVCISVSLDPGKKPLQIAPLIFISLIENAFKHGVSPTEPSHICISICGYDDGRVCCEILNSNYPKNETDKSGNGIGLTQVHRRLELAYPGKYEWNKGIGSSGDVYTSTLTIQTY